MNTNLFQGLSLAKVLNGLNKTLGLVNQAIPLYNSFKPILKNASSLMKIVDLMNTKDNLKEQVKEIPNVKSIEKKESNNLPTFFQ